MLVMRRRRGSWSVSTGFCARTSSRGRCFANHLDFQDQLDRWAEKANGRVHRTIRAVPAERLAKRARACGRCGADASTTDRRLGDEGACSSHWSGWIATTTRSTQRSLAGVSRCGSPRREITAAVLDTGELAARHGAVFAAG